MIRAYHGTSTEVLANLENGVLHHPYLTPNPLLAAYYAEEQTDVDDGEPVVLLVVVEDEALLRYDGNAMDEPVMVKEEDYDAAVERLSAQHPEWVKNGYFIPPVTAWRVSWEAVSSVWYHGDLTEWSIDS